jgi:hypothetical protein
LENQKGKRLMALLMSKVISAILKVIALETRDDTRKALWVISSQLRFGE